MSRSASSSATELFNRLHFGRSFTALPDMIPGSQLIVLTDQNLMHLYEAALSRWPSIVLPPGETAKTLPVIEGILKQLMELEADRTTCLVGIGGGVICDIAGFVAAIYKRGMRSGIVPTTLLAMVDAAVGGKNGINFSGLKNMIGTIRHPDFLIYDHSLLETLPVSEWQNGFAEIIKHACIFDEDLLQVLEAGSVRVFQKNQEQLGQLIKQNVQLKLSVVAEDEREQHRRKILNFGHTLGHALEQQYQLPHGQAVSMGMVAASELSEKILGFQQKERIKAVLAKYQLPTKRPLYEEALFEKLKQDKKIKGHEIDFILLADIGRPVIRPLSPEAIQSALQAP